MLTVNLYYFNSYLVEILQSFLKCKIQSNEHTSHIILQQAKAC